MGVPVVQVGGMGVFVFQRLMPVGMGGRLGAFVSAVVVLDCFLNVSVGVIDPDEQTVRLR